MDFPVLTWRLMVRIPIGAVWPWHFCTYCPGCWGGNSRFCLLCSFMIPTKLICF